MVNPFSVDPSGATLAASESGKQQHRQHSNGAVQAGCCCHGAANIAKKKSAKKKSLVLGARGAGAPAPKNKFRNQRARESAGVLFRATFTEHFSNESDDSSSVWSISG
jgi:hypothetical protein